MSKVKLTAEQKDNRKWYEKWEDYFAEGYYESLFPSQEEVLTGIKNAIKSNKSKES